MNGRLIREAREAKRWSIQRLATAAGLSINGVWLIEHGKTTPRLESIEKLCRALGLPLDEALRP